MSSPNEESGSSLPPPGASGAGSPGRADGPPGALRAPPLSRRSRLPSLDVQRQTSNAVALLGYLGPMQEGAPYNPAGAAGTTAAAASVGGAATAASAAATPTLTPPPPPPTTGAPPFAAAAAAPSPIVPPLLQQQPQQQQQQRPQPKPALPPLPPTYQSDLSRRAVPLGAGASARGTGMLARPGSTAPPSLPPSSAGVPPPTSKSSHNPAAARAAPGGHAQHEHPHVPWNPLRRFTGGAHLHPHSNHSGSGPAGGGPGPSGASVDSTSAAHNRAAAAAPVRQRALGDVIIGDDPNTSVAVPSAAARLYVDMNAEEIGEQARAATRGARLVHPLDPRYRAWWMVTIGAALATGWIEPFRIAFLETRSQGVAQSPNMWLNALSLSVLALFCLDIVVSFFVGYYDADGILVMRHRAVARHYIGGRLWVDLLTTLPWDWMVVAAIGINKAPAGSSEALAASYVSLLGLLQLGRMYRVGLLFRHMTYNMAVSLLATTLVRNLVLTFYLLHWAACAFYFIARQQVASANVRGEPEPLTWWSSKDDLVKTSAIPTQYVLSFYWSIVTFATLGYGDVTPNGIPEVAFVIFFVAVNVIAMAYIVGTTTLLVTKGDERIGRYRDRMASLSSYCATNRLSGELKASMAGMLKLHMSLADDLVADETLLAVYPTTVRRRILRELYGRQLAGCYLLEGAGQKFLDALMVGARVELFMPRVEVVAQGDHVNELYVVVAGHMEVVDPGGQEATAGGAGGAGGGGGGGVGGDPSVRGGGGGGADDGGEDVLPVKSAYGLGGSLNGSASGGGLGPADTVAVTIPEEGTGGGSGGRGLGALGGGGSGGGTNGGGGGGGSFFGGGSDNAGAAAGAPAASAARPSAFRQLVRNLTGARSGRSAATGASSGDGGGGEGDDGLGSPPRPIGRASVGSAGSGGAGLNRPTRTIGRTSSLPTTAFDHPGAYYRPRRRQRPRDPAAVAAAAALFGAAGGNGAAGSNPGDAHAALDVLAGGSVLPPEVQKAVASSGARVLGPGDAFAEVAFFTEAPKAESVRALTVCRLLVVSRATYNALAADFPVSARRVLENLKERAERLVEELVPPELAGQLLTADGRFGGEAAAAAGAVPGSADGGGGGGAAAAATAAAAAGKPMPSAVPHRRPPLPSERPMRSLGTLSVPLFSAAAGAAAAEGLARGSKGHASLRRSLEGPQPLLPPSSAAAAARAAPTPGPPAAAELTVAQQRLCADLVRLRQMVRRAAARHDLTRVQSLLTAAAAGDADTVASLVTRGGMPPDAADYEGRTALMVASGRGHRDVVLMLLFLGADPRRADSRGATPLVAAAEGGFTAIVDVLVRHGATLGLDPVVEAATLCKAVHEGKLPLLRVLLRAGARASAQDYDGQAPLHAAAADGNLAAARVLVEAGGASPLQADRWERTPLDVALRARCAPVAEYLAQQAGAEAAAAARARCVAESAEDLLSACAEGDGAAVARLLAAGANAVSADYGGRPAAAVAAARGHLACMRLLLAAGADPAAADGDGRTLLHEAAARGDVAVLEAVAEAEAAARGGGGGGAGAGAGGGAAAGGAGATAAATAGGNFVPLARAAGYHWTPRDILGCTPLDDARRSGKPEAVAFLQGRT